MVRWFDAFQRRHPLLGFPIAVVYKYVDDQGAYLAASLTYYTFVAIFPLLLIASSVLGFFLQGNQELQDQLLDTALAQFPIVGSQLGRPGSIQGSTIGVVVGTLTALYGAMGLGQAAQNVLNTAWAVPRNSRLNPVASRLRTLLLMVAAGATLLVLTAVPGLVSNLDRLGLGVSGWVKWLGTGISVLVVGLVLAVMLRFTTSSRPSFRATLPGAMLIAVEWHLLQLAGGLYVEHVIVRASDMNKVFALVLGLVALIYLAAVMTLIGIELDVVLSRRLYPRALLTPFTDAVALTEADRRAYTSYAQAQRHKGFERVEVTFGDGPPDDQGSPQPASGR